MAATPRSCFFRGAADATIPRVCLLLFLLAPPTLVASSVSGEEEASLNGSCIAAERDALLSFKAGITGDPTELLKSWRRQDCCRWYGVRCSTRTGHVVKLDLRNNFFMEDLDSADDQAVHWLHGQISSSLLSLPHLKHLDLSGNALGGNMSIPEFIGSLKSLMYLNLSNINFGGRVPPQLGNLTKLVYLDIHKYYYYALFYADAYSSDISWLASLHSLEHLDMSGVNLSSAVHWVHAVNNLPNLRLLYLSKCDLNSSTPSLVHHNLTVLEELDLSRNPFNSPAAPNWYWAVTSLKSLDISLCGLSGPFPDELGNLTMLQTLDMGGNNINGMIPSTLQNQCSLRIIYLNNNNIGGDITDIIGRIPKCSWKSLQELGLWSVNISGTLNWVLNLTTLRVLNIMYNKLSGSVPVEIGTLTNLTYLDISQNSLSGVISEGHFSGLTNLKAIDLSNNSLQVRVDSDWKPSFNLEGAYLSSCHLGSQVPNWLRWQNNILVLDISDTGLTSRIPDWFWTTFSKAVRLDLSRNQITGELPLNLEFMSVAMLHLQSNHLTGSVPQLPRSIRILDISENSLNRQLPSNFGAPHLHVVLLFSNCITGVIPESICRWPQLQILDLSNNLLTRGLPDCGRKDLKQWNPSSHNSSMGSSPSSYILEIHTLLLNNNNLSGGFPLFLKQCKNLMFLDLTQNKFSGTLPAWISEGMPSLVMLRLRSNNFSGHIPIKTTRLFSLRILDLANNAFSGLIPQYLEKFKALTSTDATSHQMDNPFIEGYNVAYGFTGDGISDNSLSLVIKGQVLDYRENVIFFMSIDLSCNRFTGQIPEEIGSLVGLKNLNLSSNFLSGNIPYKIGNLQSLESLDLSNNQFSGDIPQQLSNLTSLSYLNLSYNNLSGRIPSGHQLDTLKTDNPASMYIGNPGLCGHPLLVACPGDQPAQGGPVRWHEDDSNRMDFHLSLIVGFLVGLWTVFCGFLFKKNWRYAYFSLFDKLYVKVHVFSVLTWQRWFRKPGTKLSKHYEGSMSSRLDW